MKETVSCRKSLTLTNLWMGRCGLHPQRARPLAAHMQFYHVKSWERFQHYKDRNPPWIKLHFELLSSMDWVVLDDASRVLAVACMLIASRNNGRVPADPHYMKRVAYLNTLPKFKPLIDCGFLEITQADASTLQADASTLQADASTLQADASTLQADARPETETETERTLVRKEYTPEFENWWKSYPRHDCSKSDAARAYKKAIDEGITHETLLQAAKAYAKYTAGTEQRYIKHAASWLNSRSWEGDYTVIPCKTTPNQAVQKQMRLPTQKEL